MIWLALLFLAAPVRADEKWEEVARYDDMTLFRKEVPGSSVLAYRGVGLVAAPLGKLVSVILDTSRKREWMSRIKEARVLKVVSPLERIEYIHVGTPWPVKDRDFVYRTWTEVDKPAHRIIIHYASIDDAQWPDAEGKVRAFVHFGTFALSPDGNRTKIEAETHTDPRGAIPKWIVNIFQKKIARQSLSGLIEQVAKPGIPESPLAKELAP